MIEKVSTGNPKLDELLKGGFPKRSLILLAGGPGAGKTIFSAKFIHEGTIKGEPGVYVCFAESSDTFVRSMEAFGMGFRTLVEEGRVALLDLSVGTEIDVQRCLDQILERITSLRAKRLVIDSVTAMSVGLRSELDKRHLVYLLYNLVHRSGCTTVMITDMPWGSDRIGESMEEFIAVPKPAAPSRQMFYLVGGKFTRCEGASNTHRDRELQNIPGCDRRKRS